MNSQITINKENILNAYNQASGEQKALLENMFGKDMFQPQDIKERVKTFDDAVVILENDNQAVIDYYAIAEKTCTEDILAFAKLRVIAEALNEGWKPKFDGDECRYYPWFYIYTKEEYEELDEDEKKECRVVGRSSDNSVRVAVSSMRTRTAHYRTRARMAALGSPSRQESLLITAESSLSIFGRNFYLHN